VGNTAGTPAAGAAAGAAGAAGQIRSHLKDKKKTDADKTGDNKDAKATDKKPEKKDEKKDEKKGVIHGKAGAAGAPAAAGAPGEGAPGAAAKTPKAGGKTTGGAGKGGGAQVSVQGNANYEPTQERPLKYGEVPDEGEPITVSGPMTVNEFLQNINMATNWNIVASKDAQEVELQFWLAEKKPQEALEVLKFHDLYYEWKPDTKYLYVMTKKEWLEKEFGKQKTTEFTAKHADPSYLESVLASMMSPNGRVVTDQRTGHIYVWDTQDNIEQMKRAIEAVDVPLQKAEFTVHNADLADIETALNGLQSGNGNIISDARTGQIIVWDTPDILGQMKETVARLDVAVESQTFAMNYVNAEDVVDSVQAVISERGLVQVDPRSNAIIVTDLPARVTKIKELVASLDKKLDTRTWVIKYADVDFVAEQIQNLIPEQMGQITVNDDVHQITVTGLGTRLDEIDKLVQTWDIKRKQVLIEAYIVEVDADIERKFSIDWSYFASQGNIPITIQSGNGAGNVAKAPGSGQTMNVGQLPYKVPLYGALQLDSAGKIVRPIVNNINGKAVIDKFGGNNVSTALSYLDSENKATILASPRVVVQDGQEAIFENATKVPYVSAMSSYNPYSSTTGTTSTGTSTSSTTTGTTTGTTTTTPTTTVNPYYASAYSMYGGNQNRVEFIDVGTILNVTPRISEEDNILLDVSAEDSSYVEVDVKANDQVSTIPQKTLRHAETQLRVHTGDTIVMGGLRKHTVSKATTKTPILGDIPLLGRLFSNPDRVAKNDTLMIFITTTIVDEYTHPETATLEKATDNIADGTRKANHNLWERMRDEMSPEMRKRTPGVKEIGVSIGQTGNIHSEGKKASLDDLRKAFFMNYGKQKPVVVIRRHPDAPEEVISQVMEVAMEAGVRVEFDDTIAPIVPAYAPEPTAPEPPQPAPRPEPEKK
jgi:type II secretory pathway component GspD/PulD (secretin)